MAEGQRAIFAHKGQNTHDTTPTHCAVVSGPRQGSEISQIAEADPRLACIDGVRLGGGEMDLRDPKDPKEPILRRHLGNGDIDLLLIFGGFMHVLQQQSAGSSCAWNSSGTGPVRIWMARSACRPVMPMAGCVFTKCGRSELRTRSSMTTQRYFWAPPLCRRYDVIAASRAPTNEHAVISLPRTTPYLRSASFKSTTCLHAVYAWICRDSVCTEVSSQRSAPAQGSSHGQKPAQRSAPTAPQCSKTVTRQESHPLLSSQVICSCQQWQRTTRTFPGNCRQDEDSTCEETRLYLSKVRCDGRSRVVLEQGGDP